jgi:hypothetical protein
MITVTVTVPPECAWTVSTPTSWISELSPASGQGDGNVVFRASPNATASAREGEIVVNDNRVRVVQEGSACNFAIAPAEQTIGAAASDGGVVVAATSGCAWSAQSHAGWITITSGASGTGNGTVAYRVTTNEGGPRVGTLTIAPASRSAT